MELTEYQMKQDYENTTDYNETSDPVFPKIPLSPIEVIQILLPLELTLPEWSDILLQLMMFILIIGRWLLPKGKLSRDQLSQLLLVQFGMAADILELLSEGLSADFVNTQGVLWVLSVWSWSLPQFTLSLTVTRTRKPRCSPRLEAQVSSREERNYYRYRELCCATEMWSIFLTLFMQDVPFLMLRLYIIFSGIVKSTVTTQAVFFSCKNVVIILLQLYRVGVILSENREEKNTWQLAQLRNAREERHPEMPRRNTEELIEPGPITCEETTTGMVWHTQQAGMYNPPN
ncbi:transmembrane protein 26-like isoform X2 [Acanthaster planci]|nr:transmembrane protein 26-like isoform X2 [Acanthaster planci]